MLKLLKNSRGLSLTEVIVATGIIGIATMATMSLQKTNIDIQRQNQVVNTAQQMKTKIEALIRDQRSWDVTMANNGTMACLRNRTDCQGIVGPQVFNIWESTGASPFINSGAADDGSTAGPGFNETGAACNAYSPTGNSQCPFSFFTSWTPTCTGGPCFNPMIRIRVVMFYRPTSGSPVELNTQKYSFDGPNGFIYRTPGSSGRNFRLVHQSPSPAGTCSTGAAQPRPLTTADDPQNVVVGVTPAGRFTLGSGTYKCSVNSVGFAVDGFTASLIETSGATVVGSGSGFAPQWVQSSVSFEATFTVPANTTRSYELRQVCESLPGGVPSANNMGLGMPVGVGVAPYATASVFASVACTSLQ